jgi:hypothetical protein
MNKLERARKFLGGIIRNTALAVAPLAVLALSAGQAKADVVFWGNSGDSQSLTSVNGIQGLKLTGTSVCSEGPCSGLSLSWTGFWSGGSGSGFVVPITYDFFVDAARGSSGQAFSWFLFLSGGPFAQHSGSGFVVPGESSQITGAFKEVSFFGTSGFFMVDLYVSGTDLAALTVPGNSIDINPSALSPVPEPSSVGMLMLGTGGGAILMLRSRRRKQDATIRPDGIAD